MEDLQRPPTILITLPIMNVLLLRDNKNTKTKNQGNFVTLKNINTHHTTQDQPRDQTDFERFYSFLFPQVCRD